MEEYSLDLIFVLKLGIDHLFSVGGGWLFFPKSLKLEFFQTKYKHLFF